MSNIRFLGALSAAAMTVALACAGAASAATVAYTSDGSWGATNCTSGCQYQGNTFQIGSGAGSNDSKLIITDFSANFSTDATMRLGQITWENRATTTTDTSFNLVYALELNFSQPSNLPPDTTNFTFLIQQPTNPPGDSVSNMNIGIPNIGPFALAGVTISNIRWVISSAGSGSTFNSATGQWYNPEGNNATIQLVADFKATPVPEPASFAILGAGLLGLAAARRARREG